jgi:glycosyltransferase involved in cell wall biosynthesis
MLRSAASYWKAHGIEGEILCAGAVPGSYAASLQAAGYLIHHLPFTPIPAFLMSIYRFLQSHKYDAIHIHTERAGFWYATLAYLTGHRRIVRSIHSVFPFTGGLRARRRLQRLIMRRALGVQMAAASESVKRSEQRTFHNTTSVISNWFDSDSYSPPLPGERDAARAALGIEPHALVISSIGNCSLIKNHAAILQALSQAPNNSNIVYLHVGEEQADCQERRLTSELGLSAQVRFLGPLINARSVLHASDLFVMPSLHEGFGIAAVEAMGAGLPVALADVEGLLDFHTLSASIHWIAPTTAGVASAILYVQHLDPAERRAIGERLSTAAHQRFGITVGAAQYAALYRGEPGISIAAKVVVPC